MESLNPHVNTLHAAFCAVSGQDLPMLPSPEEAEVFLPLTKGFTTVILWSQFQRIRGKKYYAKVCDTGGVYAFRRDWRMAKDIPLHDDLMEPPKDFRVDHKNLDSLDNRPWNLRVCTKSQNGANRRSWNKTGFKGVKKMQNGKWQARVMAKSVGVFSTIVEAAIAYDAAARKAFGEFARTNF